MSIKEPIVVWSHTVSDAGMKYRAILIPFEHPNYKHMYKAHRSRTEGRPSVQFEECSSSAKDALGQDIWTKIQEPPSSFIVDAAEMMAELGNGKELIPCAAPAAVAPTVSDPPQPSPSDSKSESVHQQVVNRYMDMFIIGVFCVGVPTIFVLLWLIWRALSK